jgi:hypothetical protein
LYAQYLMRSANQSAKSANLYQKIMECVSRGQLAPTVFSDRLPAFVQTRGTDYANRLAEINTRFFSGMVQLNTTYSHELIDVVLPGASIPPVTPPAFDAADPIRWFQQLTDYASQLNAAAVSAYQSLLERVAAGQAAPNRVQEASADTLNQRLPEYLRRLSSLYFDLLNQLNDLRSGYEEDFLAGVLATAQAQDQEMPVALNLVAPIGGMTSASLLLTNTQDQPAIIRGSVTDIRRADGVGPAFAPKVSLAPEALELRPGEEGSMILSLRLDEGDYVPDVLYVGAVHITRQGEPRVEVPLRVTATPAAPAAAPAAPTAASARQRSTAQTMP